MSNNLLNISSIKIPARLQAPAKLLSRYIAKKRLADQEFVPQELNPSDIRKLFKSFKEGTRIPPQVEDALCELSKALGKNLGKKIPIEIIKEAIQRRAKQNLLLNYLYLSYLQKTRNNVSFEVWLFSKSKSKKVERIALDIFGPDYKYVYKKIKTDSKIILQNRILSGELGDIVHSVTSSLSDVKTYFQKLLKIDPVEGRREFLFSSHLHTLRHTIGEFIGAQTLKKILDDFPECRIYINVNFSGDLSQNKKFYDLIIMNPETKKIFAVAEVKTWRKALKDAVKKGVKQLHESEGGRQTNYFSQKLHTSNALIINFENNKMKVSMDTKLPPILPHVHFRNYSKDFYAGLSYAKQYLIIPEPPHGAKTEFKEFIRTELKKYDSINNMELLFMNFDGIPISYKTIEDISIELARKI